MVRLDSWQQLQNNVRYKLFRISEDWHPMKTHRSTVGQQSWMCRLAIVIATQLLNVPAWSQTEEGPLGGPEAVTRVRAWR